MELLLCLGASVLFFLVAAVCELARSGLEALFVELSGQMENMERRFRLLREQLREPDERER